MIGSCKTERRRIPGALPISFDGAIRCVTITVGIVCALLSVSCRFSFAADRYSAEVIGHAQGIDVTQINAVLQDHRGMIWAGSKRGLYLYDGYTATLFQHDPSDSRSLSDNFIRCIFEDSRGTVWVGTDSGGLNAFDRATNSFRHFKHDDHNPAGINNNNVYSLAEDTTGGLLVGTLSGFSRIDLSSGAVTRFDRAGVPAELAKEEVISLHIDRNGAMWVGTKSFGLYRRDPHTGVFTNYRHVDHDPTSLRNDDVVAIADAPGGDLWIGTDAGLDRITDLDRPQIRFLQTVAENAALPSPVITSFAQRSGNSLAIGTTAGAILIPADGYPPIALPTKANRPLTIAVEIDRDGAVWAGTGSGLERISKVDPFLASLTVNSPAPDHDYVTSILQDQRKQLWVGTTTGLVRTGPTGKDSKTYPESQFGRWILNLAETNDGAIWISSFARLVRIGPDGTSTQVYLGDRLPGHLPDTYLLRLLADRHGQLWIGSYDRGLYRLKPGSRSFERFNHSAGDPTSISGDDIGSLLESSDGSIWVGGRSGVLDRCNAVTAQCRQVLPGMKTQETIASANVTSICEDSSNRIWVGTAGAGLILLNRDGTHLLARYGKNNGLPDWNVVSLLPDRNNLWIGTLGGLARLDLNSSLIRRYSSSDGLPEGDFVAGAALRLGDKIAFGSTTGLRLFDPDAQQDMPVASPTVLTSVVAREPRGVEAPARRIEDPIAVNYGTAISVQYAVLDFKSAADHEYAYRLEGRSGDWIDLGSERALTFSNLAPGKYALTVRGRGANGLWSNATALQIRVIPPWWMTWWFRLGAAAVGLLLLLGIPVMHIMRLRKRYQKMVDMKRDREKAFTEVTAAQRALHSAYERLKVLTRKLEVASETERRRIANELHDELGQCLTVAKINLQLIPGAQENARRIQDTIQLIDEMISRVRELSLNLKPPLLYELGLVPALSAFLDSQRQRSGLDFAVDLDGCQTPVPAEIAAAAFRIVQEATTNAIRHSKGSRVAVRLETRDGMLKILVMDNGCGFDTDAPDVTKHMGLTGIRERGQILDGDVAIHSAPGEGTAVSVEIPIAGDAAPSSDGITL